MFAVELLPHLYSDRLVHLLGYTSQLYALSIVAHINMKALLMTIYREWICGPSTCDTLTALAIGAVPYSPHNEQSNTGHLYH